MLNANFALFEKLTSPDWSNAFGIWHPIPIRPAARNSPAKTDTEFAKETSGSFTKWTTPIASWRSLRSATDVRSTGSKTWGAMDKELAAFLNQRFQETRRHFEVVAEGLRGEIRIVAEGKLSGSLTEDPRMGMLEALDA